jgi:hypothetical protein
MYFHSEFVAKDHGAETLVKLEGPDITNADITLQLDRAMPIALDWWCKRREPLYIRTARGFKKDRKLFEARKFWNQCRELESQYNIGF